MLKFTGQNFEELVKFGYEHMDNGVNDAGVRCNFYVKYITDDFDHPLNFKTIEDTKVYRTLYINIETRVVMAYNDYFDTEIECEDWFDDLIAAGLIQKGGGT